MASPKRTVLTMEERLKVLDDLKMFGITKVAKKYNVHPATICRIKKQAAKVMEFVDKGKMQKKRRKIRPSPYDAMEQNLMSWFTERTTLGDIISNAVLLQKAAELKNSMGLPSDFKVSRGWLDGFKKRHDIQLVKVHEEAASADEDAAKEFCDHFLSFLEAEAIDEDNVYNMAETGLLWNTFPSKTLTGRIEKSRGYISRKERITVALCANATGTHKLMPLVINKYESPGAPETCESRLPVVFKSEKNARMTKCLFYDWYENYFKPSARAHQTRNGEPGKIVLLLHNCEVRTVPSMLLDEDNIKVIYIPPSTTSLIQPMEQGIIAKLKVIYRQKMFRKATTYESDINSYQEKITLKDCIEMLHGSWMEVSRDNIVNSWKNIIPNQTDAYHRAMRQDINHLTGDSYTEEDIIEFMSTCEKEEGRISTEKGDEENQKDDKIYAVKTEVVANNTEENIIEFMSTCEAEEGKIFTQKKDEETQHDDNIYLVKTEEVESNTEEGIVEFMSTCEEEGRRISTEKEGEENQLIEKIYVMKPEVVESNREELEKLFQCLEEKMSQELPVVQNMLKVVKNHVLGIDE